MTARILVVEDEFFIAQEIADALAGAGYEVVGPFARVARALEQLEKEPCDAAVLDVSLRNESSLQVAQWLALRNIPYLVVTGFSLAQLPQEMRATSVLAKPLAAADLTGALKAILPAD